MGKKKICTKCGKSRNLNDYYKDKTKLNGLRPDCKICSKEIGRKYLLNPINKEKRKQYAKRYNLLNPLYQKEYIKIHKEKISIRQSEYRKNHIKEIRIQEAGYYMKNKKTINDKSYKRRKDISVRLYDQAKSRAKKKGIFFNIEVKDLIIPKFCPALGIEIIPGKGRAWANSPSLDRIDPLKGYERDNIVVVSHKANTMKQDATIEEIGKLYQFYSNIGGK